MAAIAILWRAQKHQTQAYSPLTMQTPTMFTTMLPIFVFMAVTETRCLAFLSKEAKNMGKPAQKQCPVSRSVATSNLNKQIRL